MITKGQWGTFCDRVQILQSFGYNLLLDGRPISQVKWGDNELRVYNQIELTVTKYKYPESCEHVPNLEALYSRIRFNATMYDLYKAKVEVTNRNS